MTAQVDQKQLAVTISHQEQSVTTWAMDSHGLISGNAQSQALRMSPVTESDIQ